MAKKRIPGGKPPLQGEILPPEPPVNKDVVGDPTKLFIDNPWVKASVFFLWTAMGIWLALDETYDPDEEDET